MGNTLFVDPDPAAARREKRNGWLMIGGGCLIVGVILWLAWHYLFSRFFMG